MHVNKTNFQMKGFALGLALKQRQNATWKSPIGSTQSHNVFSLTEVQPNCLKYQSKLYPGRLFAMKWPSAGPFAIFSALNVLNSRNDFAQH